MAKVEEFREQKLTERIAANVPGEFEARTAIIKIPEHWKKYQVPVTPVQQTVPAPQAQTGILATGGA